MARGLNVVALISGGKDSLFSILHCQANDHNIVALGNLHPAVDARSGSVEDLESFMYQTIGHAVIPLYEHALNLPLFRQSITGSAVDQRKSYGSSVLASNSVLDETESIMPLLQKVLAAYPEVNAVSTGAILSDYQRTRVESVALRLGLVPLSYLWQWPSLPPCNPLSLLEDMAAAGQDARIIKVASGGLDDGFLFQNVADPRIIVRLQKAAERFGSINDGAVLGEGGEYETLSLDGPRPLWKGRIVIKDADAKAVPGEAGSASLKICNASVEMKEEAENSDFHLRVPAVFDEKFFKMLEELNGSNTDEANPVVEDNTAPVAEASDQRDSMSATFSDDNIFAIPQISGVGSTIAEQTRSIMDSLLQHLAKRNLKESNVAYSTIILRDMNDFSTVNSVYGKHFLEPNPPSRLTIACAECLPEGACLSIGFVIAKPCTDGLHVQSRSYWAPANIGPYSQAIRVVCNGTSNLPTAQVYMAGQIPLVPASMELVKPPAGSHESNFVYETVLALQHLVRIGHVMKLKNWVLGLAFIAGPRSDGQRLDAKAKIIQRAWIKLHTVVEPDAAESIVDEEFDVWHLRNRSFSTQWHLHSTDEAPSGSQNEHQTTVPPLKIFRVDDLPRNSGIEWAGYGQTQDGSFSVASFHLEGLFHALRDCNIGGSG